MSEGPAGDDPLRVIVTRNSEYRVRDRVCVEVVDRRTRRADTSHRALAARLLGALRCGRDGSLRVIERDFEPGDRLVFSSAVLTSPVVRVCTGAPEHRAAQGG